jgi:hypothetical protein
MASTDKSWIGRPTETHAPSYAKHYFQFTDGQIDLVESLTQECIGTCAFFTAIPREKIDFRYAPNKWTTKGVFAHIIETERILQYRALRFSRKDETNLAGFDENQYMQNNNYENCTLEQLIEEYKIVRKSSVLLFRNMDSSMLDFVGTANNTQNTARNIGWFIIGHSLHHIQIITERYLK